MNHARKPNPGRAGGVLGVMGPARAAALGLFATLCGLGPPGFAAQDQPPSPPPLTPTQTDQGIDLDGSLDDPAWRAAALIETFYETVFGDNREPAVKTAARIMYDSRYLYVGLKCDDPDPSKIRAPYVDRDNVIGTDDNVAVFIDARNDRRLAQEFRVNPRGIQGDAIFYDATSNEDFAPDFYYDTAARITKAGWEAEMRIPLSSLRYPRGDPQSWGILVWRNYPREFRYAIYSSPLPRGSSCLVCHLHEMAGLTDLPSSNHVVVAPYVAAQDVAVADPLGSPLSGRGTDTRFGLDAKWNPGPNTALDATINPDFSQVEADIAQIAVNQRFALFFPEKRPFFLEGVDLFDTPIQAVYSRTITAPRWGGRATGKIRDSTYTLLAAQDRGGGLVILPGPVGSTFGPQDFRSLVAIGRVRQELGRSFVGALATVREIDGGGHNRLFGPDFQWRPGELDVITGQALWSDSQTVDRPDLTPEWDGRELSGHGLDLAWRRRTRTYDWALRYKDIGSDFRADDGFVPRVGYRRAIGDVGYSIYPRSGVFSGLRPYATADLNWERGGDVLEQGFVLPGLFLLGKRNLQAQLELRLDRVRAGDSLFDRKQVFAGFQIDPSRRFTRIALTGFLGEQVDFANVRGGRGGSLTAQATLRPTSHLTLEPLLAVDWLDVTRVQGGRGRLFTAQVQRLKGTYHFSPRLFVRLIGQYVKADNDPALFTFPVPERSGDFSGSLLLSYRLNWQTAVFIGYGDNRALDERFDLKRADRQVFVKVSYAVQR